MNGTWTREECEYLEDKWGTASLKTIAKKLNRSENAIRVKIQRLGLGAFLVNGDYVTWNQLLLTLGLFGGTGYKTMSWIQNRKFPIKTKKVNNCSFKVVYLKDWWKWARENKTFLNFSNFEENSLGEEPQWAKEKRRHDVELNRKYIKTPWTKTEDEKLKKLLKDYKYTYDDLSKMLRRTNGAILRRCCDLGLKERPVKADNHIKWTEEEFQTLDRMVDDGCSYEKMSEIIRKSAKAIRGKVYVMYGTENLDKVRAKKDVS